MIDKEILDLICCPNCQGNLVKEDDKMKCISCGSFFREKSGVLILITKELEDELRS